MKSLYRIAVLVGLATAPLPAWAWGPVVHQVVTDKAIDTLPKELRKFYKDHRLELPTLAPDAEPAGEEGPERRFAVDRLMAFPFADLPRSEAEIEARFGKEKAAIGRLPWLIQETFQGLVAAFRAGDRTRILEGSDRLAGLVTDLRNPLALTGNADGQQTGQHGLWIRWSTRFPEAAKAALKLNPDAAHYLDDPNEYVFAIINATYIWVDNILYTEDLARRGKGGYTEIYFAALEERAAVILRSHLGFAASDIGSYWYTAWTDAGRPELK
jgi:hypothetical protein